MNWRLLLLCVCVTLFPEVLQAAVNISPQTFRVLEQTEKLLNQKAYPQAIGKIRKRLANVSKPLEQALLLRALASAYVLRGQNAQAATALERALATHALPETQRSETLLTLGQLYLTLEKPDKAVTLLERWLRSTASVRAGDHAMLAQAYSRLKQYRKALQHISQALEMTEKPQDGWLELRLALNYELKNYRAAINDVKQLIRLHPERENYWQQLAGLYQLANQHITAAAVMELERFLGFPDQQRAILNLVSLLRLIHTPYLAASRLETALKKGHVSHTHKHLDLLSALWTEAREFDRAISTLEQAAKLASDGKTWLRLGQLYYEREEWHAAAKALRSALKQGGLKHPGQTWLLLGSVSLELKQLDQARRAFKKAIGYANTRQSAEQWLNYIERLPVS